MNHLHCLNYVSTQRQEVRFWELAVVVKNLPVSVGDVRNVDLIPGSERSLEEEMAPHSSILARRTPWTEEPDGLQSWVAKSRTWLSIWAFIHSFNPHIKQPHLWSTSRLERHLTYICPFPSYIPPESLQNSSISQHDAKNLPQFSDSVSQTPLREKETFSIHFIIINKGLSFHHSWSLESLTQEWKKVRIYIFILDWRNQWDSKRTKRYQMLLNYFTLT